MRTVAVVVSILAALAGGAIAFWKLRPAGRVAIAPTRQELKKEEPFPHGLWTSVLKKHSKDGFVNYKALQADHADLDAYLGFVAKFSPESKPESFPTREDRMAYAINAYNAYVVKGVIDHYPCESVKSIGTIPYDFFKKIEYPFGGKSYTLNAWETKARATSPTPGSTSRSTALPSAARASRKKRSNRRGSRSSWRGRRRGS